MATATVEGSFAQTGPATPVVESARVDEVMPRAKMATRVRMILAIIVAIIMLIPVYWMATTAIKSRPDAVAAPPKLIFAPSLDGFIGLFFDLLRGELLERLLLVGRIVVVAGRGRPGAEAYGPGRLAQSRAPLIAATRNLRAGLLRGFGNRRHSGLERARYG